MASASADEPRPAAFFDLDKTIIAMSSSSALSRPLLDGGLLTRTAALRTAYASLLFHVGGADEKQTNRLRDALSELISGWDVAKLKHILDETVQQHIDPVVYEEALELIRAHHELGRDVIIVSASAREVVEPIAALLGADGVIATTMTVEDGRFTGGIDFYAFGENKAVAMREFARGARVRPAAQLCILGFDYRHAHARSGGQRVRRESGPRATPRRRRQRLGNASLPQASGAARLGNANLRRGEPRARGRCRRRHGPHCTRHAPTPRQNVTDL